jgi:hypothetical protein
MAHLVEQPKRQGDVTTDRTAGACPTSAQFAAASPRSRPHFFARPLNREPALERMRQAAREGGGIGRGLALDDARLVQEKIGIILEPVG